MDVFDNNTDNTPKVDVFTALEKFQTTATVNSVISLKYIIKSLFNASLDEGYVPPSEPLPVSSTPKLSSKYIAYLSDLGASETILDAQTWFSNNIGFFAIIPFVVFSLAVLTAELKGAITQIALKAQYTENKINKITITDVSTALNAAQKNTDLSDKANEVLALHGISADSEDLIREQLKTLTSPEMVFENYHRGKISKGELIIELKRRGYDDKEMNFYLNISDRIPTLGDAFNFADNHAFDDKMSNDYANDNEMPDEFRAFGEMQGYDYLTLQLFWRSHWKLPGFGEALELLHRGKLSESEYDTYLQFQSISPFWRERLKELSYLTYNRLDIRRLRQHNLIDKLGVFKCYKDMGYNDERAGVMSDLIEELVNEDKNKVTVTNIINMYSKQLLDKSTATEMLVKRNTKKEDIDFLFSQADFEIEDNRNIQLLKACEAQYKRNKDDKTNIINRLNKAGFTHLQPSLLFESWDLSLESVFKEPSKSDILSWFTNGLITQSKDAVELLVSIGYSETVATYYIDDLIITMGKK